MTEQPESLIEKAKKVHACLPQRDCSHCGFKTCEHFAMAIVSGEAFPDTCRKLSRDQVLKIAQIV